jgi:hypothetical protein
MIGEASALSIPGAKILGIVQPGRSGGLHAGNGERRKFPDFACLSIKRGVPRANDDAAATAAEEQMTEIPNFCPLEFQRAT